MNNRAAPDSFISGAKFYRKELASRPYCRWASSCAITAAGGLQTSGSGTTRFLIRRIKSRRRGKDLPSAAAATFRPAASRSKPLSAFRPSRKRPVAAISPGPDTARNSIRMVSYITRENAGYSQRRSNTATLRTVQGVHHERLGAGVDADRFVHYG
jgi:hypothetical protein